MRTDTDSSDGVYVARQERLRTLMESRRVPHLLVTHLVNIRYLTGFSGSAGLLLFGPARGTLWVDPRYTLQARQEVHGAVEVIEEKRGILKAAARGLKRLRIRDLGFEASYLNCAQFNQLREEAGQHVRLKPAGELVEELRAVKDATEIEAMRGAGRLTADVFTEIMRCVRVGMSESDLAAEIEYRMRKRGAEGAAFETIVVSGARSAHPHARPSSKVLQESDLVIFDLGAILRGYAADMTRTLFLGQPARRVRTLYAEVLNAQQTAIRSVEDGTRVGQVDATARRILAREGLARFFTHSTGHGVGLEIHERPRLARRETARLEVGSVVTVEPGVYLEGLGGIRIEDTVLVGPQGPEVLTPASKESWIVD